MWRALFLGSPVVGPRPTLAARDVCIIYTITERVWKFNKWRLHKHSGSTYPDNCMYVIFTDIYMGLRSPGHLSPGLGNIVWHGDGALMSAFGTIILHWRNVEIEYPDYPTLQTRLFKYQHSSHIITNFFLSLHKSAGYQYLFLHMIRNR